MEFQPRRGWGWFLGIAIVIATGLTVAPAVKAEVSFCSAGSGAGECKRLVPGSGRDVAVDSESGRVYVTDGGNNRIDVFEANGDFVLAFGWGVRDGSFELQSCTTASGCQEGIGGSGAGQLNNPWSVAVDNNPGSATRHDIYVGGDFRVQRFDPEGHFELGFGWGVRDGGGALQTCGPEATPPTSTCHAGINGPQGSLKGECQIGHFNDTLAVGPAGGVYVADSALEAPEETKGFKDRIEEFSPDGGCVAETILFEAGPDRLNDIAIDSTGAAYVVVGGNEIRKYDSAGSQLCAFDQGTQPSALALDGEDHLFAGEQASLRLISESDSACNVVRRFAYGSLVRRPLGLAVFSSPDGSVFAGEEEGEVHYLAEPPSGPVIAAPSTGASAIGSAKATLGAEVNPEGKETQYRFDYVTKAACDEDVGNGGECFEEAVSIEGTLEEDGGGAAEDFELHRAAATAGCPEPAKEADEPGNDCLTPSTEYRFRIVVENADGGGNSPVEGAFTTKPPVEFGDVWSTAVDLDTAHLHGEVDPLGIPAAAWFEYVSDATYQSDIAELGPGHGFDHAAQSPDVSGGQAPLSLGSGNGFVTVATSLFPLAANTLYRYRLTAEDLLSGPIAGPEGTFRTFAKATGEACPANEAFHTGPSALLPDCRAYELVSPLDKSNGDVVALNGFFTRFPAVLRQSSTSGSRLAYGSYRSFGDVEAAPFTTQYIASRDEGRKEWVSHGISPPRRNPIFRAIFTSLDTELKALSPDLCEGWVRMTYDPPLTANAPAGYPNLYRRTDEECGGAPDYEALAPVKWQNIVPAEEENAAVSLELQGLSADGSHAVYVVPDSLPGSGAPDLGGGASQLYVWAGGPNPVFACILPNGKALKSPCIAGGAPNVGSKGWMASANVQNAISADGERVFWTAAEGGPGKIYVRERPEQGKVTGECAGENACTIAISGEAETLSGVTGSRFMAASREGSKAVFLTGEDLYLYDVESGTTRLIAHHAVPDSEAGLLGASMDLSRVYFASTDVMGGENSEGAVAKVGEPNLYLDEEGTVRFIGTLDHKDSFEKSSPLAREPRFHLAQVTPDGRGAVFMSRAKLTGYDNVDASSGEADAELFLYEPNANGGEGKLVCVSCNPTGARPTGRNIGGQFAEFWAAGSIPPPENALHAARVISTDGRRVFFESADALSRRDTNGKQDVYQWEATGKGRCDESSASFSAPAAGCIDLVSSGQGSRASELIDTSPSGDDVFFATLSSLVPQDYGLVDIYDARADGGLPPPAPAPEECEGEACQSPPAPAQVPTPSSSSLGGARQALRPKAKRCSKGKKAVIRKGGARCVPRHRRGSRKRPHRHSRRANR